MGLARDIALGFLIALLLIPLLLIILTIIGIGMLPTLTNTTSPTQLQPPTQTVQNPYQVTDTPAGIQYNGPPTTALAGYYCVYTADVANDGWLVNGQYQPNPQILANSPPGYSVQLNAILNNGYFLQNTYGSSRVFANGVLKSINTAVNVWYNSKLASVKQGPPGQPCGWLIIAISNGTAYFGYSSDGVNVDWYYTYPVGNATIEPTMGTNLVIAGPGGSAGVNFTKVYAVLALYYWNGTAWKPITAIPVSPGGAYTAEFVVNAWVYTSGNEAVVSWPMAVNASIAIPSVSPPGFTP